MKRVWNIAWRDFRAYFMSPIAYVIIALFLFIMGWFFFNNFNFFIQSASRMNPYGGGGTTPSVTEGIIRPLYGNMNLTLLFIVPFISMRLIAEEKKMHTMELLLTAPLKQWQIVVGKYFSGLLLLSTLLVPTLAYPLILGVASNPDWGPIFSAYLGTYLMAGCYLSIGLFFSSVTENQIVSGILTIVTSLFFWLISWAAYSAGGAWSDFLNYASLITHLNNFLRGVFDTSDFVFYLSFIFIGLFLTHRSLDSYRWRS